MKNKIFRALVLACLGAFLTTSFVACGSKNDSTDTTAIEEQVEAPAEQEEEVIDTASDGEPEEETVEVEAPEAQEGETEKEHAETLLKRYFQIYDEILSVEDQGAANMITTSETFLPNEGKKYKFKELERERHTILGRKAF